MPRSFNDLRERLLRAGVAPRHVRRYLRELADHLADLRAEEERAGRNRADAESAALARLGGMDELARAMTEQRQFQSWCVRAPWAAFGVAPLLVLAGAWCVALLILSLGWRTFLPGAETPLGVRQYGLANVYFQVDRAFYYAAPIFIGWGMGLLAVRQRLKAIWPMAGLVPIALMAATARVHANHAEGVGIRFAHVLSIPSALVVLSLMALPYLIWRARNGAAAAGLLMLAAGVAFGQTAAKPEFDVADIRQNKSDDKGATGGVIPGGQLSVRNAPLKTLLGFAYYPGMQRFRDKFIVGAPGWVDSDRFDIAAKAPANMPARQCFFSNYCYPDKRLALMLRGFLEQRFKMTVHQEQRPIGVYALVVAKGGSKLKNSAGSGEMNCRRIVGGSDDPAAKDLSEIQAGFVCVNMPMANLVEFLPDMAGAYIDRPVVDSTALQGAYDFRLTWVGRASIDQGGLTVFDALGKQLGLKLEERMAPMPFTVIDHIEKLDDGN